MPPSRPRSIVQGLSIPPSEGHLPPLRAQSRKGGRGGARVARKGASQEGVRCSRRRKGGARGREEVDFGTPPDLLQCPPKTAECLPAGPPSRGSVTRTRPGLAPVPTPRARGWARGGAAEGARTLLDMLPGDSCPGEGGEGRDGTGVPPAGVPLALPHNPHLHPPSPISNRHTQKPASSRPPAQTHE